jgi:hypothetical protein
VLLIVGLGVDVLLIGYVLYLLWNTTRTPKTVVAPVPTPRATVELWDAYGQARAAVRAQAEDAQLVSASTQWQTANERTLLGGAHNWTFVFHSPASRSSFDVAADAGTAQVVNETGVEIAPETMDEGAWQAGPQDALLVFLAAGGRAFLAKHPQAMVDLHLGRDDAGRMVWTVVALDPGDRSLLSVLVDAETNEILPS